MDTRRQSLRLSPTMRNALLHAWPDQEGRIRLDTTGACTPRTRKALEHRGLTVPNSYVLSAQGAEAFYAISLEWVTAREGN